MEKLENNTEHICSYGCGQLAKYKFVNGKFCCEKIPSMCESLKNDSTIRATGKSNGSLSDEHKQKISKANKGRIKSKEECEAIRNRLLGTNHKEETKEKISKSNKGRRAWNKGIKTGPLPKNIKIGIKSRERCLNGHALVMAKAPRDPEKIKISSEKSRQRMLNGGAVYVQSFIKNPSKPQVELYNRIKELFPSAILNYPFYPFNYSLDVAIPELKIWFESDGSYYHQDKEKDLKRQIKIEVLGWKCIRYKANSVREVPALEKIKEDINKIK